MATGKKAMTKNQVVAYMADKFQTPKKVAGAMVEEFANLAIAQTKKVGVFVFPGVGKLVKVARKARIGRNPATGATIKIPAKTVVKMRLLKACQEAIVPKK